MDSLAQECQHEKVTKWGINCLIFGGIAMMLLVAAFVSPRDGETLVNNLQYWERNQVITWLLVLNIMSVATGVSIKMFLQAENPPTDMVPSSWMETAIIPVLGSMLVWCMFIPGVHLIW